MAAHIGIVACSAEGAALCYRTICSEAPALMGEHCHPEITMHTHPLSEYMPHIRSGNWKGVAELMLSSASKLEDAGADFAICPDNTIHQAFDMVAEKSALPWLHIADAITRKAKETDAHKLGITGTKYLMTGPVYPDALAKVGLECEIPSEEDMERINTIIFKELVNGVFTEESREFFNEVMSKFKQKGCDAIVLGCTEIPLLVDPEGSPLPVLDSTRLLAGAALKHALATAADTDNEHDNLHAMLSELHDELESPHDLDESTRSLLVSVRSDIQKAIGGDTHAIEDLKDTDIPQQLEDAVYKLEGSHPKLTSVLKRVVETLSNMGI